jgi:hypothetical protein
MKVIGVEIKSGEYQGRQYCNAVIHGTYPVKNGVGVATAFEKVKYAKLCEILGVERVDEPVIKERIMGKNLEFAYDRWQNVAYITEEKA